MAHQWSPTYPKFRPYHISGVYVANMILFNARKDVSYYQLEVFDGEWNPITFASKAKLIKAPLHSTTNVDVYIHKSKLKIVKYICTRSMVKKEDARDTVVASRICSKVK